MVPIPIAAAPIMFGKGNPAAYMTSAAPNNPFAPLPKPRAALLLPFLVVLYLFLPLGIEVVDPVVVLVVWLTLVLIVTVFPLIVLIWD